MFNLYLIKKIQEMHLEKLFTPKLRKTILKRLNKLIDVHPFLLVYKKEKSPRRLKYLNEHHYNNCIDYKYIVDAIGYNRIKTNNLEQYPFLHVDIFKEYDLKSIKENKYLNHEFFRNFGC